MKDLIYPYSEYYSTVTEWGAVSIQSLGFIGFRIPDL